MKKVKFIRKATIILGITTLFSSAIVNLIPTPVKASIDENNSSESETNIETGNKYGYLNKKVFPNNWKGYWGGKGKYTANGPIINEGFGDTIGNSGIAEYGYVKGTKSFPWQMPEEWKKDCEGKGLFLHTYRRTWVTKDGVTWAILGYPLSEPIQKDDLALTCKTEKIKRKKYRFIFLASSKKFKVKTQYFRTKKMTKKYKHHKFDDVEYSTHF